MTTQTKQFFNQMTKSNKDTLFQIHFGFKKQNSIDSFLFLKGNLLTMDSDEIPKDHVTRQSDKKPLLRFPSLHPVKRERVGEGFQAKPQHFDIQEYENKRKSKDFHLEIFYLIIKLRYCWRYAMEL
jgi:hypothetical protein